LKARELIESGVLGKLGDVTYRMSSSHHCNPTGHFANCNKPEDLPWRLMPDFSGGGLIMDVGCHAIDMMDFLVGPLVHDASSGDARKVGPFPQMSEVEDVVRLVMTGLDGVRISASWNFATPLREDMITICGTKGALQLSCFGTEPLQLTCMLKDGTVTTKEYDFEQLEHVQQVALPPQFEPPLSLHTASFGHSEHFMHRDGFASCFAPSNKSPSSCPFFPHSPYSGSP
jgi:predicted dehydrogenase